MGESIVKLTRADVEPKPVGRPSSMQNGKRVNVYFDAISLANAENIGNAK